jgi:tRNA threonylcarbamoyladenosine biosynthesis protein TsaB
MKILALEFSSDHRSAAVMDCPPGGPSMLRGAAAEIGGPGARPLCLVEEALRESGVQREQIEVIAIGLGPGSYAGIRTAIAMGQGWQLARGIKLLGIGSVECLATEARARQWTGIIDFLIDAQRNEFYYARYELGAGAPRMVSPLKLITLAEALAYGKDNHLLAGPGMTRWFPTARDLYPAAAGLGQLAAGRVHFVPGDTMEPIYLRVPGFRKAPPPRTITVPDQTQA